MNFEVLRQSALAEIANVKNAKELADFRIKYFGRKGKIAGLLENLKIISREERAQMGKEINLLKKEIAALIESRAFSFKYKTADQKEWIDVTAPGAKISRGRLHPLSLVGQQVENIFQSMGFSIIEGPEVETEYYNFDALNIPANYPVRDLWDTFWLKPEKAKLLLRTHTSPVQIHYMEKHQPPLRLIAPGRCFRHEATDASHDFQFHQVEGLMVDKVNSIHSISIANFKGVLEQFFSRFFAKDIKIRLIPSYFSFVEPGFQVDITCPVCNAMPARITRVSVSGGRSITGRPKGKCSLCRGSGYLEIMGAGMVHPNVFKNVGYNPNDWQGFAFGFGVERLTMIKYGISDIRLFHSGDLRFLKWR